MLTQSFSEFEKNDEKPKIDRPNSQNNFKDENDKFENIMLRIKARSDLVWQSIIMSISSRFSEEVYALDSGVILNNLIEILRQESSRKDLVNQIENKEVQSLILFEQDELNKLNLLANHLIELRKSKYRS